MPNPARVTVQMLAALTGEWHDIAHQFKRKDAEYLAAHGQETVGITYRIKPERPTP